jgi:hypothetical protein
VARESAGSEGSRGFAIGRRAFSALTALGATSLAGIGVAGCRRKEGAPAAVIEKPIPVVPDDGAVAEPGTTRLLEWSLSSDRAAAVMVPAWAEETSRFPLLIALHGRGEALKSPNEGALGWPRDYALRRAMYRLMNPPLTVADYEGFTGPDELASTNAALAHKPFRGMVVLCPYSPDIDLRNVDAIRDYGRYLFEVLVPKARRELPVFSSPSATGIDGVSLGGAIALRVGLERAGQVGAVGTLQPAIQEGDAGEIVKLVGAARRENPKLAFRLLSSTDDYFKSAVVAASRALTSRGLEHDFLVCTGPHDYPFNRGPGALEMLMWHDRQLARS